MLYTRARAFVRAFREGARPPEPLDALACDLARHQASHNVNFARLCRARGVDLATLTEAAAIPPVPTDAFKLSRVASFPDAETAKTFRTSGTTVGARGAHAMSARGLALYDEAAVHFGKHWLARDHQSMPILVLGPSPVEAPDSSLMHMCEAFRTSFGVPSTAQDTYLVEGDVIDLGTFDERVATAIAKSEPVLVLGTSFAYVHFLDALGDATFALPAGSRAMQTGGYKGKSREVAPEVLRRDLARVFGIDVRAIVGEYGMTELASQFYEKTMFDADAPLGRYVEPPWARVVPVDPQTLAPVAAGEVGIAKIIDLMNVESAVAVLTQDRIRRVGDDGFELLGRLPGAPPRGCSIAIDELLGRGLS